MIKMVVTDLDDTLLRNDKSVYRYAIDIMQKIKKIGIKVIFATARVESTKHLVPYEIFDGYVLLNGAKVYIDNKLIYDRGITAEIYIPFLRNISNNNLKVTTEINGIHYSNFNVKSKWSYIDNFVITDFINVIGEADKLYAIIEKPGQVDIIKSNMPKDLYLNVSRDGLV